METNTLIENKQKLCYLCGRELGDDPAQIDLDHVPAKQIYPEPRDSFKNLLTKQTHKNCNSSYCRDEEYFVHSMSAWVSDTNTGKQKFDNVFSTYKKGHNRGLLEKVRKEFDPRPSGLYLPGGKVVKRFEGERIFRVIWKITRGLFYYEYDRVLPENTPKTFLNICTPTETLEEWNFLWDAPSKGRHGYVFDYLYKQIPEWKFHVWGLVFWNKLMFFVAFHDPDCDCEKCSQP